MAALLTNNGAGVLNAGITTAATSITLNSGQGALFPNPTAPDYFMATLYNAGGTTEIVKCTARATDTLTVVRGQEGTAAFAFSAGDKLDMRMTAGAFANKLDKDTGGTVSGTIQATGLQVGSDPTVTLVAAQTLTNKTLTAPTITAPVMTTISSGGHTLTLPSAAADTLVGRATTDTLSNKTLSGIAEVSTVLDDAGNPYRIGTKGIPQNAQSANYTLVLADRSKHILSEPGSNITITIPTNASVPFIVEDWVSLLNFNVAGATVTISPASGVTLLWAGTGASGARIVSSLGWVTILQIAANTWVISGVNIT